MEAPEKIYRTTTYLDNDRGKTLWKTKPVAGAENIEYTRTDAFIKKTEEFLYEKLNSGEMECGDIIAFINDFRNYMKGE